MSTGENIVADINLNNRPAFYDDEGFNYMNFWSGRAYEHKSEVIAIRRLLSGRTFEHAADIAGGYGRLSVVLSEFADKVTLVDSSSQQLALAADFLANHPDVEKRLMDAAKLDFPDGSVDLVAMASYASPARPGGRARRGAPDPASRRHGDRRGSELGTRAKPGPSHGQDRAAARHSA
jgi:SAM-dependent methyltransferase